MEIFRNDLFFYTVYEIGFFPCIPSEPKYSHDQTSAIETFTKVHRKPLKMSFDAND